MKIQNKINNLIEFTTNTSLRITSKTYASSAADACTSTGENESEKKGRNCWLPPYVDGVVGGPQISSSNSDWEARNAVKMTAICVINFSHEPNILLAFSGLFCCCCCCCCRVAHNYAANNN